MASPSSHLPAPVNILRYNQHPGQNIGDTHGPGSPDNPVLPSLDER